uniref:Uncharacterized protein n=1 Tax=Cacopsylla melanoneura TaxID=428564 RepID=A0A8D9BQ85_9HEMI
MSVLITTHNVRFVHILVNLCSEILRRDLMGQGNEDLVSRMNQLEGHCMGGKRMGEEEGVRVLAEEVERVANLRLADQLKTAAHCVKEARLQASEITSNIKQLEIAIIKLNSEGTDFLKSNSLNENLSDEATKLQDFHRQAAARSSHLNQLIGQTASLLSNVTTCNQNADTPLLHLNGGEGAPVDLAAVVKQGRQFRESNPMVRMFGTADQGVKHGQRNY